MITTVDRNNGYVVQKVTKPDGKLVRYQVKPEDVFDSEQVLVCANLTLARAAIGKTHTGQQIEQIESALA